MTLATCLYNISVAYAAPNPNVPLAVSAITISLLGTRQSISGSPGVFPTTASSFSPSSEVTSVQSDQTIYSIDNGGTNPAASLKHSYVALGDSFSAGIGAGNFLQSCNWLCTDGSFPYQFRNDTHVFASHANLTFLALSGASTNMVWDGQVNIGSRLPTGADLYSLTVGGNDVNFAGILWNCVYNFTPYFASRNCQKLLNAVEPLVTPGSNFDIMLHRILSKLVEASDQRRYPSNQIAMLPYVQYYGNQTSGLFNGCHLSQSLRHQLNAAVDTVNTAIARIVHSHPPIIMVSAAALGERFDGHRFCDSGRPYIQSAIQNFVSPIEWKRYLLTGNFTSPVLSRLNKQFNNESDPYTEIPDPSHKTENYWINPGFFHPNFEGYREYSRALASAIKSTTALRLHDDGGVEDWCQSQPPCCRICQISMAESLFGMVYQKIEHFYTFIHTFIEHISKALKGTSACLP